MPSQFFGLTIAGSGLRNSNAALNTTANNIANVQTEGYSRQQVDSQAANALRTFATYGCAGAGVETLSIERVRDSFYDVKFRENNSSYGQFEIKSYYAKEVEKYFDDDGNSGFVTIFNKMKDALQTVTTNPSSTSTKASFVASVQALTDYFNGLYGNLQQVQKDINLEIKQSVDQINSISSQIATLNKQINVIELSGSKANDLRDQRDLLVDTLSEYIDVSTTETPIYDTNDPTRETGGSRYVVKVAGGQLLIDGNDYNELSCVSRENYEQINQTDVAGLYKITWANGNTFNLNNAAMNGKLKGLAELRDGNNGANFTGTIAAGGVGTKTTDASGNTTYTVTVDVTADYLTNLDECMLPSDGGEINIGNALYYYDKWEVGSRDANGNITSYKFTINDDVSASKTITEGSMAKTQESIKYQGIPYYMTQMNAFLRSFTEKINGIFAQEDGTAQAMNAYGNTGTNLFSCNLASGEQDYSAMQSTEYYYMTAGNVCVSEALLRDADLLGTRTAKCVNPTAGAGNYQYDSIGVEECGQVEEVIDTLTTKSKFNFRNAPANQMLELILSDVALNASNADTYTKTYEGLKNSIDNQRVSISGVDEDEEAVNLVKYQNSYTLASKMIQTLTEIYDQLILSTGV